MDGTETTGGETDMPEPTRDAASWREEKPEVTAARIEFAAFIAKCNHGGTIQFSAVVNGIVRSEYVRVTAACPALLEEIIRAYQFVSIDNGTLLINVTNVRKPE